MCNFAVPAIPVVRIGYVGIGGRGSGAVSRMTNIKNVEIEALCDIREEATKPINRRWRVKDSCCRRIFWKRDCFQEDVR